MNNKFSLILFIFFAAACDDSKKTSLESRVHSSDTACMQEIVEAKADIKNSKSIYCNYVGNIIWQALRSEKEMDSLLTLYSITYKDESSPDVIQPNKNYHCYCEFMQEKLIEKFGDNFTDSLLYTADSLWVIKNRNKVFDCGSKSSCWDKPAMFPGDSTYDQINHSGLQEEFDKLVKYPTNYRTRQGEKSMAMLQVYLDIDENGSAKVTNTQFVFWDNRTKEEDYNKQYWDYIKSIAIPLIEKTTWRPATIKSIGVKSKNDIFIYLR